MQTTADQPGDAEQEPAELEEDLAAARATWASQGIVTYALEFSFDVEDDESQGTCGVNGELLIQVIVGSVGSAVDRSTGCEVDVDNPGEVPLTVEDLFDLVEANMAASALEVEYEPDFGYPRVLRAEEGGQVIEARVTSFTPGRS